MSFQYMGYEYVVCPYCKHLVPFLGYHWINGEARCTGEGIVDVAQAVIEAAGKEASE
ncbi:MAG: hypothetical protein ACE5IJ_11295 [Thermoplasmata archaeon]